MFKKILLPFFIISVFGCNAEQIQTNQNYQYITVPANRDNPEDSKTIDIAYLKIPAAKESGKPPIIFLQGGPGGSSLSWSGFWYNTKLHEEHDIIIFDQRYTGFSQSQCTWASSSLFEIARKNLSLEDEIAEIKKIATKCRKEFISNGVDIKSISTKENVEDIEDLRKEIKASKIIILGGSYGTRLGVKYLEKYQANVSASILLSMFPPSVSLHNNLMKNFEKSFNYLTQLCENDENCNSKYPDLQTVHTSNLLTLNKSPIKVSFNNEDFYLNAQDYLINLQQMLYNKRSAELIPKYIYSIQRKDHRTIINGISTTNRVISAFNSGAFWGYFTNEPKDQIIIDKLYTEGSKTGISLFIADKSIFKSWGKNNKNESIEILKQIKTRTLIVNGNLDPITPTSDAKLTLNKMPNSQLVEFPFEGHVVFNPCFFNLAAKFLNNEKLDTKCSKNSSMNFN